MCACKTPVSHSTRAFWRHTRRRFESTHGGVLNLYTHTHTRHQQQRDGQTPTDVSLLIYISLHMSVCLLIRLSFSLALSGRLSFFLFSMTMTMSTRPVGSLCTHGPDSPKCRSACALAHSLSGEHVRIMHETTVLCHLE